MTAMIAIHRRRTTGQVLDSGLIDFALPLSQDHASAPHNQEDSDFGRGLFCSAATRRFIYLGPNRARPLTQIKAFVGGIGQKKMIATMAATIAFLGIGARQVNGCET